MSTLRKKISKLAPAIFNLSVRWYLPELAGLYICLIAKKMNPNRKYRVLCLGRSIFMDDVKAIIEFSGNVQYVYFHKGLLKKIARHFIPHPELNERNYHVDRRFEAGRKKAQAFTSRMFRVMRGLLRFDAVLSANFGYVDQQEFFLVCRKKKIPAIVLLKEGVWMKAFPDNLMENYQGWRFLGAKLLVINEAVKRYMTRYIHGVTNDLVEPVGIPRFDYYRSVPEPGGRQMVLFSFFPDDYFLGEIDDALRSKIAHISSEFHRDVMAFARTNPAWRVVIKTKVAEHYVSYVQGIWDRCFGGRRPENLIITSKQEPRTLIAESQAVLGFNSSTLVEALLANRKVITPYFNDVIPQQAWDIFFMDFPGLVQYARTCADLERIVTQEPALPPATADEREKFFNVYIFSADGMASSRAEQAIIRTIEDFRAGAGH